jgi:hypothetical protein
MYLALLARRWRIRTLIAPAACLVLGASATTVGATTLRNDAGGVPSSCPSVSYVKSQLQVKLNGVRDQTSIPEFPNGSPAVPKAHARTLVRICTYTMNGRFTSTSNIVPVTITFAGSVSKKDFGMARRSASQGAKPVTVPHLGTKAFYVKAPTYDPRAGSSLFVLTGTTEISISAPPTASHSGLLSLARKLT